MAMKPSNRVAAIFSFGSVLEWPGHPAVKPDDLSVVNHVRRLARDLAYDVLFRLHVASLMVVTCCRW